MNDYGTVQSKGFRAVQERAGKELDRPEGDSGSALHVSPSVRLSVCRRLSVRLSVCLSVRLRYSTDVMWCQPL
jgi:hypothetical protein